MKRPFEKVEPFFTIVGAVATVITLLVSLAPTSPIIDKIKISGAKLLIPENYEIVPAPLNKVQENSTFKISAGQSALLTEEEVTFSLEKNRGKNSVVISIDGKRVILRKGTHQDISETNCFIWLHQIDVEQDQYSFEVKC